MGQNIKNFLKSFQDWYVDKSTTIGSFPEDLTKIEIRIIEKQLEDISRQMKRLSNLSSKSAEEMLEEYSLIFNILEEKIDYVEDVADLFLYLNSFYDMNNTVDIKNYKIRGLDNKELSYDNRVKGLSITNKINSFNCVKQITDGGDTLTFYNTNLSYHSGFKIEGNNLSQLKLREATIHKVDGTLLNVSLSGIEEDVFYIRNDLTSSTQIVVKLPQNYNGLSSTEKSYIDSLSISLLDYTYNHGGSIVLEPQIFESSKLFNIIYDAEVPSGTYCNLQLHVIGNDLNLNEVKRESFTVPLKSPVICKQLDQVDWETVGDIMGVYINDRLITNRKILTEKFLKSRENKNEMFLLFKKNSEETSGAYFKLINNQTIKILNKNIRDLKVEVTVEMFTFKRGSSPLLMTLAGVTKSE